MRQKIITLTAIVLAAAGIISLIILLAAGNGNEQNAGTDNTEMKKAVWQIDGETGLDSVIGLTFVENQNILSYDSLSIYAPGEYIVRDSYTINENGAVGDYTAATAPIIVSADLSGDEIKAFVRKGIVCVVLNAGDKDFAVNSPMTVTAFKAAVKYIRKNNTLIPGSADMIFAVGDSDYAGVCASVGASGDSVAFYTYLDYCGASTAGMSGAYLSDSVTGVICTNGNYLNEMELSEIEWMLGLGNTYGDYIKSLFPQELDVDTVSAYKTEITDFIGKAAYSYIYERSYPCEIDGVEYESPDRLAEHLNSDVEWICADQPLLAYKTVSVKSVSDFMKYRETITGIPDLTLYSDTDFDKMSRAEKHKFEICNPLYWLSDHYQGKGSSVPARAWYISSGIFGGNSFVRDFNLAKAASDAIENSDVAVTAEWSDKSVRAPEYLSRWIHGIVFPESENAVG